MPAFVSTKETVWLKIKCLSIRVDAYAIKTYKPKYYTDE